MHAFRCPECSALLFLEELKCRNCGTEVGLHVPTQTMLPVFPDGSSPPVEFAGTRWEACSNRIWLCNWLVESDAPEAQCFSCRLIRRRPDADDTIALEKLSATDQARRRLLLRIMTLGLPITPWYEREGGLGFDLISSASGGERVTIGHANGIITIDLIETLDEYRERLRVHLGEPYRTMLGHFRHEVGHYYEWLLVEQTHWIEECRTLFGDERRSYAEAISRHYANGAPEGWEEHYISEYATMHPWEDFAETWAHYLHMTDTLNTLAVGAVRFDYHMYADLIDHEVNPRRSYYGVSTEILLNDWKWCSMLLNRANQAMGRGDLYPFTIVPEVARKLDFVHRVVQASAVGPQTVLAG